MIEGKKGRRVEVEKKLQITKYKLQLQCPKSHTKKQKPVRVCTKILLSCKP
jgi:hypothetical protein